MNSKFKSIKPIRHVPSENDIVYINIDCDSNYFDTSEQIHIKNTTWFTETTSPTMISGSNVVAGLFSKKSIKKDDSSYSSVAYPAGSTVVDSSGASRKILSLSIDFYASSSIDGYRNGVEITENKHWTAGLAKITAGTPGHLVDDTFFGVPKVSVIDADKFFDVNTFNPVSYIIDGGSVFGSYMFPIITADYNQLENYILDGIIEPLPIRSVVSNFSINFPIEPHSVKAEFGNGNVGFSRSSDQIETVDYFEPDRQTRKFFLDAAETIIFKNDDCTITASLGPAVGYVNLDENYTSPFEDVVYPRGEQPSLTYDNELLTVINKLPISASSYVPRKKKSNTCGFVYDNNPEGTDSIAYGGLLH